MARPTVRNGELHAFEVTRLAAADGARADCGGVEVRLPGGVTGDRGTLAVTHVGQHAAWGRIVALTVPSPQRVAPPCRVVDRCGGCPWQHASLELQRAERLRDLHAQLDPWLAEARWQPWLGAPLEVGYRTRALWMARRPAQRGETRRQGRLVLGLYAPHSNQLVPIDDCVVQHPTVSRVLAGVREVLDRSGVDCWRDASRPGQLRAVAFRCDPSLDQGLLTLVVSHTGGLDRLASELMSVPGVAGVAANVNTAEGGAVLGPTTVVLAGAARLPMRWGDLDLQVGATAFVQTRHDVAAQMLAVAADWLPVACVHLVDLYAGVGQLGLALRHRARQLTLVERDPAAVADARWNIEHLQVSHATVVAADAAAFAPHLAPEADAILLDPPRAGCAPAVLDVLASRQGTLVYVSCHPQALARDLPRLVDAGWRPTDVQPLDMFPHTPHVEVMVRLQR
jgi:23S rRNA (uracil1939-C5)-methyltransferase